MLRYTAAQGITAGPWGSPVCDVQLPCSKESQEKSFSRLWARRRLTAGPWGSQALPQHRHLL